MAIEQRVTTTPTFINGTLVPAGAVVTVDTEQFVDEDGNKPDRDVTPNLKEVGDAPVLVPTPVAAIAPTGPNPTMPQQVPPGVMQTLAGYASGEALLVAEGSEAARQAAENPPPENEGIEEEQVQRLSTTSQEAGSEGDADAALLASQPAVTVAEATPADTPPQGTNGTETGALDEGEPFTGDPLVADAQPGPSPAAPKAEWEAYAQAQGIDTEGMTKAEIIAAVNAT